MNLLAILNPLPLAFLAFAFSWTMQVLTQNEVLGLVPYMLLFCTIGIISIKYFQSKKIRYGVHGVNTLDFFLSLFFAFSTCHMLIAVTLGGYSFAEGVRYFLIYVGSGWVYFYIARYAKEEEIRMALIAIAIAAVAISVEWVYETYSKLFLLQLVDFRNMAAEYQSARFGSDEGLRADHTSLSANFRSVGLFDNYTTTGAMVALGAFASLPALSHASHRCKSLVIYAFLVVLLIGMATTALVSYLLILPFVIGFARNKWSLEKILSRIATFLLAVVVVLILMVGSMKGVNPLMDTIIDQVTNQFDILTRLDDSQGISWLTMYADNLGWYYDFISQKPVAIIFGEGVLNYGDVKYFRGGDVGLLEFVSAYGIPFAILFFTVCIAALLRTVRSLKRTDLNETQRMYLLFSFAVLVFSILSFTHYAILFVKSVFVIFFLALGLIRRYTSQQSVKSVSAVSFAKD